MLTTLAIKNFAIIEDISLDFKPGLTVLMGETGAGKSIIIDALSLLAGARSSSDYVRHGSDKAILQAQFEVGSNDRIEAFFKQEDLPLEEGTIILYRDITRAGKSSVRINGILTTVAVLKALGALLIDIHGQHEHQQLLNDKAHLGLLDQFAGEGIQEEWAAYEQAYATYLSQKKRVKQLMAMEKNDAQKVILLKQQIKMIKSISPKLGEDLELEEAFALLNEQRLAFDTFSQMEELIFNEKRGLQRLSSRALGLLEDFLTALDLEEKEQVVDQVLENDEADPSSHHKQQSGLRQDLVSLEADLIALDDLVADISKKLALQLDKVDFNQDRFDAISQRLEDLEGLKANFGDDLGEILAYYDEIQTELDAILNKDKYLEEARAAFLAAHQEVLQAGRALSLARQAVAKDLELAIHNQLKDLYLDKLVFKVAFEATDKPKLKATGIDQVQFMVATNPGEPLKPLVKVASGGELSRMMLALKTIFMQAGSLGTVVFDEIDTGVSGRVAQAIAQKMALIGQHTQALAISHLPQVAARANAQIFVSKSVVEERTQTAVAYLNMEERVQAIAHMIAGDSMGQTALNHARELLAAGQKD